jgi:hypothetical protein
MIKYVSGNDIKVPKEGGLMVINDHFARTIKGCNRGSIRPPKRRLRLVQPEGRKLLLARPRGMGSASPDPKSVGSASSDPKMGSSASPDPESAGSSLGGGAGPAEGPT